jgi:hypothetical protein
MEADLQGRESDADAEGLGDCRRHLRAARCCSCHHLQDLLSSQDATQIRSFDHIATREAVVAMKEQKFLTAPHSTIVAVYSVIVVHWALPKS